MSFSLSFINSGSGETPAMLLDFSIYFIISGSGVAFLLSSYL
uniref:Uncharacterized protein n=1 Tax=Arundo donax TaxID=35708 RepID=A0A0A9E980_ARUDO